MADGQARSRRVKDGWVVIAVAATAVVVVIAVAWLVRPPLPQASAPLPAPVVTAPSASPDASPTPVHPPTSASFPANARAYDVTTLPQVNVFALIPGLAVDDDPFAAPLPERAVARGIGAPVWGDPTAEPVAYLPREYAYDGTVVPVVEKQEHWVKVLLTGRQAMPSQGDPRQVAGWLRMADVDLAPNDASVTVSISARTIDIVHGGVVERVATDFAWGTAGTPTPTGRTFIMTTRVAPEYGYTRGHPIVYWGVQSPTLDGFAGADVAIAAFHYHDAHSGAISNGCIRVDAAAITRLAELPAGTPVMVNP